MIQNALIETRFGLVPRRIEMVAWIVFFCICIFVGSDLAQKIVGTSKLRSGATGFTLELTSTIVLLVVGFVIPLTSPFFVEFPSLRPSVVTFTDSGDLVYRKWGLWTPPWKDVEVANVPATGERLIFYFQNTSTLIEHEGKIYVLEFDGEINLNDPKKFYSDRSRRKQDSRPLGLMEREVRKAILMVHVQNEDEIKKLANSTCFVESSTYRASCPKVTDFIVEKSGVKQLLEDNGLSLKHTATVQSTDIIK
ncbi:MAG: hypothetical protein WAX44_01320 [Minisyncoccia bacterium]